MPRTRAPKDEELIDAVEQLGDAEPADDPAGGSEPGDSDIRIDQGSVAAGGDLGEFPEPVPGMSLQIREERAMAQAPASSLPSEREWKATIAVATEIARTPFVPESYRGQPEAVVAAILTGRELGIGPMQSLRDIYMMDGRPVFSASLMLAQMRRGGVEILESESTGYRAYIRARRADTGEEAEVEWTLEEAKSIPAKEKGNWITLAEKGTWKSYPSDMLWARAVGRLARRFGSDLLAGMVYTSEEMRDLAESDADGYNASTASPAITWETVEPGMILHPQAPKGWREILGVLQAVDSSRDWPWIVKGILQGKYGVARVNDLGDHFQEGGRRMANLAGYLQLVTMKGKEFPPPSDEEIVAAVQWAFDGLTLEPPLQGPAEEGEVVDADDLPLTPEEAAEMKSAMEADADDIDFGDGSAEDPD